MKEIKKYIVGFLVGLMTITGLAYADNGTIGALFEKVGGDWFLLGDNIKDGTVDGTEIQDNSLTASDIAADSVGASELANDSVASANVIDNTLTASDIAADSIGASELANNSVDSSNIIDGSIVLGDLSPTLENKINSVPTDVYTKSEVDAKLLDSGMPSMSYCGNGIESDNGSGKFACEGSRGDDSLKVSETSSSTSCSGYYKTYKYTSNGALTSIFISNGQCQGSDETFRTTPTGGLSEECLKYGGTGNYKWTYPTTGDYTWASLGVSCEVAIGGSSIGDSTVSSSNIIDGTITSSDLSSSLLSDINSESVEEGNLVWWLSASHPSASISDSGNKVALYKGFIGSDGKITNSTRLLELGSFTAGTYYDTVYNYNNKPVTCYDRKNPYKGTYEELLFRDMNLFGAVGTNKFINNLSKKVWYSASNSSGGNLCTSGNWWTIFTLNDAGIDIIHKYVQNNSGTS